MRFKQTALATSLLSTLTLAAAGVTAGETHEHEHEHHQYDAHVHGVAALNLALEGDEIHIELDSPAANIVGFEHAPSSEADHAVLDKAVATLKKGDQLFRFNQEAGCRMEKAMVTSALLEEEHHEHDESHADEDNHEKHEHEENKGESHSDIEAAYHFECDQPAKLTGLTVELFEAFPATEELNVQYIIESKQGARELTTKDHVLEF